MFGPGVTASAIAATQNRSQVASGIIDGVLPRARTRRRRRRAASLRIPERGEKRTRRALDRRAVGCRHLASPDADTVLLRRPYEVLVNARSIVALDHASAHVLATPQARNPRRALRSEVEHPRRILEAEKRADARQLDLGMQDQILVAELVVVRDRGAGGAADRDLLLPRGTERAVVLTRREPGLAPRQHSVARIADHVHVVDLGHQRSELAHDEDVVGSLLARAALALRRGIHRVER